jgi:ribonuclease PH
MYVKGYMYKQRGTMQAAVIASSVSLFLFMGFLIYNIDKHNVSTGNGIFVDQIMAVSTGCNSGVLQCDDDSCNGERITRTLVGGVPIYINLGR